MLQKKENTYVFLTATGTRMPWIIFPKETKTNQPTNQSPFKVRMQFGRTLALPLRGSGFNTQHPQNVFSTSIIQWNISAPKSYQKHNYNKENSAVAWLHSK